MTKREFAKQVGIDETYLWYIMNNRRKATKKRNEIIKRLDELEKPGA